MWRNIKHIETKMETNEDEVSEPEHRQQGSLVRAKRGEIMPENDISASLNHK